jgi:putative protein kinase ArgK-like GTPase of G3E family
MEQEPLSLTPEAALALLRREADALLAEPGRRVLGIAGGPGVGKSTMAQKLVAEIGIHEAPATRIHDAGQARERK